MHSWQRLREFAASISCALREKASSTLGSLKQQFSQRRDHVSSYNPTLSDGRQQTPIKSSEGDRLPRGLNDRSTNEHLRSRLSNSTENEFMVLYSPPKQSKDQQRLRELEQERLMLKRNIRAVDLEIQKMRDEEKVSKFQKYRNISEDIEAYEQAQKLVVKMMQDKKAFERRKQQLEKRKQELLDRQEQARNEEIEHSKQRILLERRESIQRRLELESRRREDLKVLDSLSNSLIKEIKKSEKVKRVVTEETMQFQGSTAQKQQKKSFDLPTEIHEHQKRYVEQKQRAKLSERSLDATSPLQLHKHKYHRGKFSLLVEEEEKKREEEGVMKEQLKYVHMEKRKKYGELVSQLFQQHNKTLITEIKPARDNSNANATRVKTMKGQKASEPELGERPNKRLPTEVVAPRRQVFRTEAERQQRDRQLRKHTKEKIKELEKLEDSLKNSFRQPASAVKYKNYLQVLPRIQQNDQQAVKRIMESKKLTKQQKYMEVMNKANNLEHRAKLKEEMLRNPVQNEEVVGLIVSSIQAKLALLDNL